MMPVHRRLELGRPADAFSPSFVVKRVQICVIGSKRCGEIKAGLVPVVPEG